MSNLIKFFKIRVNKGNMLIQRLLRMSVARLPPVQASERTTAAKIQIN